MTKALCALVGSGLYAAVFVALMWLIIEGMG